MYDSMIVVHLHVHVLIKLCVHYQTHTIKEVIEYLNHLRKSNSYADVFLLFSINTFTRSLNLHPLNLPFFFPIDYF